MRARRDRASAGVLAGADLLLPDGIGVVWTLRWRGLRHVERVTGVEIASLLIEQCAERGLRLALVGGVRGVAAKAARRLQAMHPGLFTPLVLDGYADLESFSVAISRLRQFRPDVVLVGLGSPRQEQWIEQAIPHFESGLFQGVGGSLDVFAGMAVRAPRTWQRRNLEWLFRVLQDPRRARRQALYIPFTILASAEVFRQRLWQRPPEA